MTNEKPKDLRELMCLFSRRPDGHYEFRVSEGVSVDRSVSEEWKDEMAIVFAIRSQIERAQRRANDSYHRMLGIISDFQKDGEK